MYKILRYGCDVMTANEQKLKSKELLLKDVDECRTLADVYTLVRDRNIDVRMRSLTSASNIPRIPLDTKTATSPEQYLENIKNAVKDAIRSNE